MRDAFFCWQAGSKNLCPVIIYDNLPSEKGPEAAGRPRILATYKISSEHIQDEEVTLSFSQLAAMFPPPKSVELENVSDKK